MGKNQKLPPLTLILLLSTMIGGVGFKNLNHPHHRASNPELPNTQVEYDYRTLVGALIGGYSPTASVYAEHADEYMHSEVGIQSNATLLMPVCGLSSTDREVHSRFTNLKPGIKKNASSDYTTQSRDFLCKFR